MHKKFLAIGLVLALCLGFGLVGCAEVQTTGNAVEEFICDPPANVVALAQAAGPFIGAALDNYFPGASLAYQGMVAILSGGMACATISQVNALIDLLSGTQDKTFRAKAMRPFFDVAPLRHWLAAKKK